MFIIRVQLLLLLFSSYIMPCKHLMKSQLVTLKQSSYEINGFNAQNFLSLSTNFINSPENNSNNNSNNNESNRNMLILNNHTSLNENSLVYKWLNTLLVEVCCCFKPILLVYLNKILFLKWPSF